MNDQDDVLISLKNKMDDTISKHNYPMIERTPTNSVNNGAILTNDDMNSSIVNTLTRKGSAQSSAYNKSKIEGNVGERLYHQGLHNFQHKMELRHNYNNDVIDACNTTKINYHSNELVRKKAKAKLDFLLGRHCKDVNEITFVEIGALFCDLGIFKLFDSEDFTTKQRVIEKFRNNPERARLEASFHDQIW